MARNTDHDLVYRMDEDLNHGVQLLRKNRSFDLQGATITLYVRKHPNTKDDDVDGTTPAGYSKIITTDVLHDLRASFVNVGFLRGDVPDATAPAAVNPSDGDRVMYWDFHVVEADHNDFYFPKPSAKFVITGGGDT